MAAISAVGPEQTSFHDPQALRAGFRQQAASTPGTLLFECTAPSAAVHPEESGTLLFRDPHSTLAAHTADELPGLIACLETALADGFHIAGYLTYEAACILEGSPSHATPQEPLAWFGLYSAPDRLPAAPLPPAPEPTATFPLCFELDTERATYLDRVVQTQRLIAAGDTYQVNLTTAVTSSFRGDLASLYAALATQQPTAFSALLHPTSGQRILSFSPELLFRTDPAGRILARPMKGTASLGPADLEASGIRADTRSPDSQLQADEKNRAEHVMIVDLLRNDLNRIATVGSVCVDPLFAVERYNTILQMTSTLTGQLRPGVNLGEILRALLPAGSMTGAPKHRTIQIIDSLEDHSRGVYSGAIGFASPDGTAVFSVPIRTLVLDQEHLRMGVGSGIVADSQPEAELAECWLKCAFLHRASTPFELVETFRWNGRSADVDRASSVPLVPTCANVEDHLDRLEISAHQLGFHFDRESIRQSLEKLALTLPHPQRIRMLLDRTGALRFEISPLDLWPDPVSLCLSPEIVWSGDTFLRHKTSYRPIYNRELARARNEGFADSLFVNERGELTEGAISSVLLLLDEQWLTPPLTSGLLPGVARARLLQTGQLAEQILREADLHRAAAVVVANGVRGTAQVRHLQLSSGAQLSFAPIDAFPWS